MEKTHLGQHGDDCFGCRIQTVQMSTSAMPTRRNNIPPKGPQYNSYENAIATDHRGMPYLGPDMQPISQKRYDEQSHRRQQAIYHPESVKDTKD